MVCHYDKMMKAEEREKKLFSKLVEDKVYSTIESGHARTQTKQKRKKCTFSGFRSFLLLFIFFSHVR